MFHFEPDPVPPLLSRLWLVGCGAMGGALLTRWIEFGLAPSAVTVIDPNPDSIVVDKVSKIPRTRFVRHYTQDRLNHDLFTIYF